MSPFDNKYLSYTDQSIYVDAFYLHGRYVEGQWRHNLALVRLHRDVTSRSAFADVIGPLDDVNGDDCLTVGWGSNGTGEPVRPSVRKWMVRNSTLCSLRHNITVHPDLLCATPLHPQGVCTTVYMFIVHISEVTGLCDQTVYMFIVHISEGDMGAPLLCRSDAKWTVRGIVTHTWRCQDNEQDPQPARFLNIQHYLPFVQKRGNFKDRRSIG
ncbi:tryptase gamma-like [Babylonia areolata]|uniref:tryptase gamma-like n=1 Tax=Babylonia areolata TaxID=304850 RepID=UPI003FD09CA0